MPVFSVQGQQCSCHTEVDEQAASPTRLTHVSSQCVLQDGVKSPQDLVIANDKVGFRAESVENPGELDGNVARTDDGDALGLILEVKEAIRVDAVACAWNLFI